MRFEALPAACFSAMLIAATAAFGLDVNVTDAPYSAAGNGTTNDRAAIQSAIDAVNAAGGGTANLNGSKTFLSGNLFLKSNVTLNINAGSTLKQTNSTAQWVQPAPLPAAKLGRMWSSIQWDGSAAHNMPFVYMGEGTKKVKVTGTGTVQACPLAAEGNMLFVVLVAAYRVDSLEVSNITLKGAHSYTTYFNHCSNGLVSNITIQNGQPDQNNDGISLEGVMNFRVTGNHITTSDDALYMVNSYNNPTYGAWASTSDLQPNKNIEIDNNVLRSGGYCGTPDNWGYHGIGFITYGEHCPEPWKNEFSNIYIHDNDVNYPQPAGFADGYPCHDGEPWGQSGGPGYNTLKDVVWRNNILVPYQQHGNSNINMGSLNHLHGFVADATITRTNTTSLDNTGFEYHELAWSLRGNASAKNDAVGQTGSWYGAVESFDKGDAKIFQGVQLTNGTYTFSAKVQSSGAAARMFVSRSFINDTTTSVASREFSNTGWADQCITFTISTAGVYRLGIERGNATSGWARIDEARLTSGNGCSTSVQDPGMRSSTHQSANSSARVCDIRGRVISVRGHRNPGGIILTEEKAGVCGVQVVMSEAIK